MAQGWLLSVPLALERMGSSAPSTSQQPQLCSRTRKGAGKARTPWLPVLDTDKLNILCKAWGFSP